MANMYGMEDNDYKRYLENKKTWETSSGVSTAAAATENSQLREKYGIKSDTASYNDLARPAVSGWQALQPQNNVSYGDRLNTGLSTMERYNRYKDAYADDVQSAYRDISNFSYNPESDQDYQNYLGSLNRQSQSAQKQTMSNLTGISGGRNNSWASAATAQVGQSYASKGADAQADFADRAYQRLLQRHNLAGQMSDRGYSRNNDMFNRQSSMVGLYNQLGQQEYSNTRQNAMDADYFRNSNQAYDQNEFNYGLDKQYAGQERMLNLQQLQQGVATGQINLDAYPEMIRQQLEQGNLSIQQANLALTTGGLQNQMLQKEIVNFGVNRGRWLFFRQSING